MRLSGSFTVAVALMASFTAVATMVHVPVVGGKVYFNLGDVVVLSSAYLLGRLGGALAGGMGSALADLLLGYPIWAPITLVIKGIEGLVAGSLCRRRSRLLAFSAGASVVAVGYPIAAGILYGPAVVPAEIVTDLVQASAGVLGAMVLTSAADRIGLTLAAQNLLSPLKR